MSEHLAGGTERAMLALTLGLAASAALFHDTYLGMVRTWLGTDTFAHGSLIVPIALVLIWRRRETLKTLAPRHRWQAVPGLLLLGGLWWVGRRAGLVTLEQAAATLLIPAWVWAVFGSAYVRALAFPLGFLLFAVPVGRELIPPLMDFTAAFATQALDLVGIPLESDERRIVLADGLAFEVVEACSGIRYFIVSLCLGTLFAHLLYRSWWRRAAMLALAVVLPIIGNGLRAFGIILIAHLTDGKLAVGVDHLLYGWVFFGLIMVLMGWLGSLWREDDGAFDHEHRPAVVSPAGRSRGRLVPWVGIAVLTPWVLQLALGESAEPSSGVLMPLRTLDAWQVSDAPVWSWRPRSEAGAEERLHGFVEGDVPVELYLSYRTDGVENAARLVPDALADKGSYRRWTLLQRGRRSEDFGDGARRLYESLAISDRETLLVWHWNWVAGRRVSGPLLPRLHEAWARLLSGRGGGAKVVAYTPTRGEQLEHARVRLRNFLSAAWPAVEPRLAAARTPKSDGAALLSADRAE